MFRRKKPWENRGGGRQTKKDNKALENEYLNQSFDITSQYQSSREASNTIKGFLILCAFIACFISLLLLIGFLFG